MIFSHVGVRVQLVGTYRENVEDQDSAELLQGFHKYLVDVSF